MLGFPVPKRAKDMRALVGIVPQQDNLDLELTVRENLEVYGRYFGLSSAEVRDRIPQLLQYAALPDKADQRIGNLSGGMKRRLSIARALINRPRLLILDEPTTGLDPHIRHNIWQLLRQLQQDGLTVILTTHYMDEAERLCDRIILMDHGRILADGAPRDLIAATSSPTCWKCTARTWRGGGKRSSATSRCGGSAWGTACIYTASSCSLGWRRWTLGPGCAIPTGPPIWRTCSCASPAGICAMFKVAPPRCVAVWRRNATVWRKGSLRSLLGSFMEPLTTLFGLGLGLGAMVGEVDHQSYLAFLSGGILVMNAMNTSTFEGLYLAYTRMHVQRIWDGMLAAPLGLEDVVLGEILWMGSKSVISNGAILLVAAAFGWCTVGRRCGYCRWRFWRGFASAAWRSW